MHDHDHDFDHDRIGLVKVKRSTALSVILAGVLGSLVFTMVPQAGGAVLPPGGTFIDDNGNPFEGSIEAIAAEGITKGCNPPVNNRFCPNDNVTRGEMALFLVRALGYTDSGGGNLFTDDDGAFYEDAADKLGAAKVTLGCNPPTNDRFCGNENVTRGQMAAFLVRAMGYTDTGGGNMFSDDDGHPFENDIDKLAAAGVTKGCHPNLFCPNELVARGQMAAFLTRALGLTPIVPPPPTLSGIRISPGESIQAAVDSNPEGAQFVLGAGTHSLSAPIRPKSGQRFIGEGSAVLTGNNATPVAFKGEAAHNVEVRGLTIEYFASVYQGRAALHAGNGWVIVGNEVRYNAGGGIFHEQDTLVTGNKIHHNGWYGIGGFKAHRSIIDNNEVYENGASGLPDRAGAKWVAGIDMVIRNNYFHHNYNNAIWLDADHVKALVEDNLVTDNYDKGIHFEASCSGVLRGNTSSRNGSGLFLVASQNTEVYDNTFIGNAEAIRVAQLDRGSGDNCYWKLNNVNIHDNTVKGGAVNVLEHQVVGGSIFAPGDGRVTFDFNNYEATTFSFNGQANWSQWQSAGNDVNGNWTP